MKARPKWAGLFLGLGLLGGRGIWIGVLSILLALVCLYLLDRTSWQKFKNWIRTGHYLDSIESDEQEGLFQTADHSQWNALKSMGLFAIGTVIVIGTLFLVRPAGLSGLAGGLTGYLSGWAASSGISIGMTILALLAYEPLALFLGIWGVVRAWREKDAYSQFMSLWAAAALLLVLIYPDRRVDFLTWVIVPLWGLAAREFLRHVQLHRSELGNTINQGILTFVILVFCWFNLQGIANNQLVGGVIATQFTAIGIALLILVIASLFVSWGWSSSIAGRGLVWGVSIFLLIYTFSMTTSAGFMRPYFTSEMWSQGSSLTDSNVLINTINEISETHTGYKNNLDVVVVGIKSPGLEWVLRKFPNTIFTSKLAVGTEPSIVISPQQTEPSLAASYRGDGFEIVTQPQWSSILPNGYIPWLVYHKAPQQSQSVILWARIDLFPGGSLTTTNPAP